MKKLALTLLVVCILFSMCACEREATIVSANISKEADNFNVCREIIVVNVRDNTVLYTLRGYFSLDNNSSNELVVISEVGDGVYKKDFIYLSEWTTYVCTDLTGANFETDLCATADNAKCEHFFSPEDNGLAQEWTGVCWCNPPYGRTVGKWVEKAARSKAKVVMLLPARTDTRWFHNWVLPYGKVEFLPGRLKFGGGGVQRPVPFHDRGV